MFFALTSISDLLSLDDVVDLTLDQSCYLEKCKLTLCVLLCREYASSINKLVEGTKVKQLSKTILYCITVYMYTCIEAAHLGVKIHKQQFQVFSGSFLLKSLVALHRNETWHYRCCDK